eukprot:CAMPEP_0170646808 /NCGR_PEP_ID=MMETSP0224-20130122/43838_1 /TAXON_ID=285029 /ORGANISM="Togula jolla, Strain CCCM 725" /LENGTH=327 /DNA_ID=CAMNT_0010978171 /DNA_START=84 /DNA_END=1064 /DNA_ORIENTATION=+
MENLAGERAFRGIHGARSQFSMVAGAMDDAYKTVLGGGAHYYKALICPADDFSMYEALVRDLDFKDCWMRRNAALSPDALGSEKALQRSPTYEKIVRWLAGFFGVEPIRSLVNFYRNGDDYTAYHSDQYFTGVNMTIGASFGEERELVFEQRESKDQFSFPQHNGDIFAFTDEVNSRFTHAVPRERRRARSAGPRHTPGRVSVIVWARRDQPEWKRLAETKPLNLLSVSQVLDYNPAATELAEEAEEKEVVAGREAVATTTRQETREAPAAEAPSLAPGPVPAPAPLRCPEVQPVTAHSFPALGDGLAKKDSTFTRENGEGSVSGAR